MAHFIKVLTDEIKQVVETPVDALPHVNVSNAAKQALTALENRSQALINSTDIPDYINAMKEFGNALVKLGEELGAQANRRLEALIVRTLQQKLPRLAAVMALAGAITPADADGFQGINWSKMGAVFTDPATIFNENLWDELLGDVGGTAEGRQIATLLALVILFPQTIIALYRDRLKISSLNVRDTDSPGNWRDFLNRTSEWLSLTLPLPDPASSTPNPASVYHLVPGITPDIAVTIAGMAVRTSNAGQRNTDFEMWFAITLDKDVWEYDFGEHWFLRVEPGISAGFGRYNDQWHAAFRALGGNHALVPAAGDPWRVSFLRDTPENQPDISFGVPFDARFEIKNFQAYLELRGVSPVIKFAMEFKDVRLVLPHRWFRTFGEGFESAFLRGLSYDGDLVWSVAEGEGFRLNHSSLLETTWFVNKRLGPMNGTNLILHSVEIKANFDATANDWRLKFELRAHVSLQLGTTLIIVLDGFGAWVGKWQEPIDDNQKEYIGFIPPDGVGLEIHAGPIVGGGFIRYEELPDGGERYSGALSLLIEGIGANAFGIYERDGQNNKSALVVIGVRFGDPGIQIGYGLAISGIGGIIGIDRRLDVDALRERLTSGSTGNVLFLEDPIRNAPSILDDLTALFPAQKGVIVVGPTVQITWLSKILSIDAGIVFEIKNDSLSKVVILGSLRAPAQFNFGSPTNPDNTENPIFNLRVDIAGLIDPVRRLIEMDGTLIHSHAFRNFRLTGDAVIRSKYGSGGFFLMSLGGFHPDHPPLPVALPSLMRIAMTAKAGFLDALPGFSIKGEMYIAFTPNTLQFGGAIEATFKKSGMTIIGTLGADALIQYTPFTFNVRVFFRAEIKWKLLTLAGVRVEGVLSGPGPTKLRATACIEVLWSDICRTGEIRIGNDPAPPIEYINSVVMALRSEITNPANLEVIRPERSGIVLKEFLESGKVRVSPDGSLVWRQRRAPLNLKLDRFENARLKDPHAITVIAAVDHWVRDDFSPGSFVDLTQAEQLHLPSYESHESGVMLSSGTRESALVTKTIEVINAIIPDPSPAISHGILWPAGVLAASGNLNAVAAPVRKPPKFRVAQDLFKVMKKDGSIVENELSAHQAHRMAKELKATSVTDADFFDMGTF